MNVRRFTIGTPVTVRAVLRVGVQSVDPDTGAILANFRRVLHREAFPEKKVAWIVGFSTRREGDLDPRGRGALRVTRSNFVWLLRFSFGGREECALDDDVEWSPLDRLRVPPLRGSSGRKP
jgi:hypothetical protein